MAPTCGGTMALPLASTSVTALWTLLDTSHAAIAATETPLTRTTPSAAARIFASAENGLRRLSWP